MAAIEYAGGGRALSRKATRRILDRLSDLYHGNLSLKEENLLLSRNVEAMFANSSQGEEGLKSS
jgi:hypothetical protein